MADNFNLAKFLRNNPLLNESIGGYKDIKLMKEDAGYTVVATNDDNDLDPNAIAKAIPGFDPNNFEILYKGDPYGGWQDNPNTAAVIASLKSGDGEFIAKKNSKLKEGYEDDDDIDYADYGVDPMDPDRRAIVRVMQDMRDLQNMKGPSLIGGIKDWLKGLKSDYEFNKKFKNSPFKMNEAKGYIQEIQMEGENPWLDDSIDGKKIGNWVVNYDDQMGTVYLEHPMIKDITVYATPGWEGVEGIALVISEDGEEKPWNEDGIVPGSRSSYESFEEYAADMVDVLNDIEFELTINQMIEGIEKGAGWIDPDYVQDTWENSSDIPFDSVASEIYTRLIDAGLLFYPDEDEPLEAGMQVRSLDQLNEAEEEDAYFDYKNNRRSFLPSPDEFQGALDSSEMSQQDFMMSLAHKDFDGDVSAIVKKTIDGLRAGGFDDQDIIDFLATDFSLDEEVSGVQMEGVEFNWKPINQQGKTPFKNLTVTITDDEIKVLADDGFSSQSYTKDDIKKAIKTGEYLRFRGHNLQLNTKMKAWANS